MLLSSPKTCHISYKRLIPPSIFPGSHDSPSSSIHQYRSILNPTWHVIILLPSHPLLSSQLVVGKLEAGKAGNGALFTILTNNPSGYERSPKSRKVRVVQLLTLIRLTNP